MLDARRLLLLALPLLVTGYAAARPAATRANMVNAVTLRACVWCALRLLRAGCVLSALLPATATRDVFNFVLIMHFLLLELLFTIPPPGSATGSTLRSIRDCDRRLRSAWRSSVVLLYSYK